MSSSHRALRFVTRAAPVFVAGMVLAVALLHPTSPFCPCEVPSAALAAPATAAAAAGGRAIETVVLRVEGMNCGGCAKALHRALAKADGVVQAEVTFEPPRATISYDAHRVRLRHIVYLIEEAGFVPFEV